MAAVFAAFWSLGGTYLLLYLVNFITAVRATAEEQLDIDSLILGEAAYLVNDDTLNEGTNFKDVPLSHWEVWTDQTEEDQFQLKDDIEQ